MNMDNYRAVYSLLALSLLAALASTVDAHGYLSTPISRNQLINNVWTAPPGIAYNSNSGNGRGFEAKGGIVQQPGVCGDPWQTITDRAYSNYVFSLPWGQAAAMANAASPNIPTFTPGQRVNFQWTITASHTGYFALKLCPQRDITDPVALQACFDRYPLQRADGQGRQWWELAYASATVTHTADFMLPAGVSCPNGCMIQWEYVTANTCWSRGMCENPSVCGQFANMANAANVCSDTLKPERFYNCADIRITGTPPPASPCPTCPAPPACQTGGGCNAATGRCNPFTNLPDGTSCTGGTCRSGACQPTCQTGGGCNTATRTCNPFTNLPNGTPCTGGTCQGGVCQSTPCQRTVAPGGACGAGVGCCPSGQCCSQWGWCGPTPAHCDAKCQPAFSSPTSTCKPRAAASAVGGRLKRFTTPAEQAIDGVVVSADNSTLLPATVAQSADAATVGATDVTATAVAAATAPELPASTVVEAAAVPSATIPQVAPHGVAVNPAAAAGGAATAAVAVSP